MDIKSFLKQNLIGIIAGGIWGFISYAMALFNQTPLMNYTIFLPGTITQLIVGQINAIGSASIILTLIIGAALGTIIQMGLRKL